MRKNGFTLIEILAILIVLSIITVITIPIITNALENSKKGTAQDSAYGYVDAINKYRFSSNLEVDFDGVYIVRDGIISGDNLSNLELSISGSNSVNGWLTYTDNDLVDGCLSINDYEVNYDDGIFNVVDKGICKLTIKGDFANDDWSTIRSNLLLDRNSYDDEIGKTKTISMVVNNQSNEYSLRLVNTQSPDICSDSSFSNTACGVVIEFANIVDKRPIGSSTEVTTGWASSEIRQFLNYDSNSVYSMLPDELKSIIIPTAPIVSSSSSYGDNNVIDVSGNFKGDYLYLLSAKEIGYNASGEVKNNIQYTRTLDYYVDKDIQAKKKYDVNNVAQRYWNRSAYLSTPNAYLYVSNAGVLLNDAMSNNYGVAPAFRIFE